MTCQTPRATADDPISAPLIAAQYCKIAKVLLIHINAAMISPQFLTIAPVALALRR
jgi:hypothetical protein